MRARSIRLSIHPNNELPFNWEGAMRTVFGPFFATDAYTLPSQLVGSAAAVALAKAVKPDPGEEGPEDGPEDGLGDSLGDGNPGEETAYGAELSGPDGVPEDMATMVLNGPPLGGGSAIQPGAGSALQPGSALRPGSTPEQRSALREELDPKSDAAIMLRVAEGDEAGFNYLATKYHRPMIHFLYRMVGNQAVAEELAQEVFLRVYRSRQTYRAEAKFSTWLYRIATNLGVNHARDTKYERTAQNVYLDQPDPETGTSPDVADSTLSVEQELVRDERMQAIRKHVMALPERQRSAVLMHKYQEMDYKEIGQILKLSESATKSLLFRAYQTLRENLKDFA